MSYSLDAVLEAAAGGAPATVAFSTEDLAVVLFALNFLERRSNWIDNSEELGDEVTDADWDEIEKLTGSVAFQIMNPLLGWIIPNVLAVLPVNLLPCDGSSYAREDYPALYTVLDPAFIVDADTFVTPDLRSRMPIGSGDGTGLSVYSVGESGGVETVTLDASEIPAHQHGLFQTDSLAVAPGELPVLIPFIAALGATDFAGGGGSHENRPPFVAVPFALVAL